MVENTRSNDKKNMTAIILAGGRSSRMGRDKSTVEFGGEPLLLRAVHRLEEIFDEIIVVTNREIPFEMTGIKVVRDEVPYQGPLGGIGAGLKASSNDMSFVVAVDMPFISPQVIDYLSELTDEADAVVPRTIHGLEPLFAFYNKRCLYEINKALVEGERKVASIFPKLNLRVAGFPEISHLDGADRTFVNINTERDLEKVEEGVKKTGPGDSNGYRRPPVERAVTIYVNDEELVTVQSSLRHLDELACGFLVAEGILRKRDELEDIRVDADRGEVRIGLRKPRAIAMAAVGKRFITSGCGKGFSFTSPGDARGAEKIDSSFKVQGEKIPALMREFLKSSRRSGMHSSAIVKEDEILMLRQDIGRHNTVDMILGRLWLDEAEDRDIMLFTTGRISYEMVVKAAKARIPVVVSRTTATDMAIELAGELGIELIGYVRGSNMQIYTEGSRVQG